MLCPSLVKVTYITPAYRSMIADTDALNQSIKILTLDEIPNRHVNPPSEDQETPTHCCYLPAPNPTIEHPSCPKATLTWIDNGGVLSTRSKLLDLLE